MSTSEFTIVRFIESMSQYVYQFDDPDTEALRRSASDWIDANADSDDEDVRLLFETTTSSDLPTTSKYPLGFEAGDDALRQIPEFVLQHGEDWESWFKHFLDAELHGLRLWQAQQPGA